MFVCWCVGVLWVVGLWGCGVVGLWVVLSWGGVELGRLMDNIGCTEECSTKVRAGALLK